MIWNIDVAHLLKTGEIVRKPDVSFSEYVVASAEYFRCEDDVRIGQAYFNTLSVIRPELAEQIRGTDFDAFHDNNLLPKMLNYAYRHW
jgi:hypothetical protein